MDRSIGSFLLLPLLLAHLLHQSTYMHTNINAGWTDADFEKPVITIGSPWTNANPCNNKARTTTVLDYL